MRTDGPRLTLKRRVTFALLGTVALFVVVQGALAYLSLREQEDDLVDELVMAEARRLASRVERGELGAGAADDQFRPGPNLSAWLFERGGRVLPGPLPAHLGSLSDGPHRPRYSGAELHVVVLPTSAGRLFVQYDAEQNEAKVRQFGVYLLGLGALCLALAALVARRVAAVVVAPIERVTGLLGDWAPEAMPGDAVVKDEESRLLEAFGRVQDRFERSIAHEREFVANVRHEIRTPLTALRTDIELAALAIEPRSPNGERLRRAIAAVDGISGSLESARALSHGQRIESQSVDLARCVDDAWASLGAHPETRGLRFANEVPPATFVDADRHALLTILRNLVRNAAEHAAPALCTVRMSAPGRPKRSSPEAHSAEGRFVSAHGIEIADDGPGIAAQDLPHVFDRYYRGRYTDAPGLAQASDRGLGLAIARQVADLNGWTLAVESEPGRGTRFTLQLR